MELTLRTVTAAMASPFTAAHGTLTDRELLLVTITGEDGLTGFGEAAPLTSYDGVTLEDVRAGLEACRPVLADYHGLAPIADVLARCSEVTVVAQALAAVDLALWDLAGRRTREPVWRLLGAGAAGPVIVNRTIAASDRSRAAEEAAQARADGFGVVKVKVGLGDDAARLAAIRAFAGPDMAIRIDANGAWSPDEARGWLRVLEPVGIELCEEPVHGAAAMRDVWIEAPVPLALDESAGDPEAMTRQAADLICLKIGACGGISATIDAATRARAAGYEVYLASTLDGPLGIAAALHAAAVISPSRACGLATLPLFHDRPDPLPAVRGSIVPPAAPGLGGDPLTEWYGR